VVGRVSGPLESSSGSMGNGCGAREGRVLEGWESGISGRFFRGELCDLFFLGDLFRLCSAVIGDSECLREVVSAPFERHCRKEQSMNNTYLESHLRQMKRPPIPLSVWI